MTLQHSVAVVSVQGRRSQDHPSDRSAITPEAPMDTSRAFSSFAVDDVDAAHRFYADLLGMDARIEGDGPMRMLVIHLGTGSRVLVYPKADHVAAGFTVFNLPVPDVDAAVDELTAAGLTMERYDGFDQDERGISRAGGPTIAWFRDPAGNIIAVLSEGPDPQ
jgi:catechol 2,3-dioxygenase-like lactoylglutathione lyase family enzyme